MRTTFLGSRTKLALLAALALVLVLPAAASARTKSAAGSERLGVTTVYVTHDQVEALTMGDRIAVMREGTLQQVGGPTEVYDRPANLFVAGFIGSPPMNLAQATLEAGDGGTVVRLGSATLPVPAEVVREQGLDAWRGKPVVAGIRPEDLHGSGDGAPETAATLPATIDRVESVGASLLVHFSVDAEPAKYAGLVAATGGEHLEEVPLTGRTGTSFCASFEPRSGSRVGEAVGVRVDTRRLHFFDPETEASLHATRETA